MTTRSRKRTAQTSTRQTQNNSAAKNTTENSSDVTHVPPMFGRPEQSSQFSLEEITHEGPLPPPQMLDGYERVVQGAAERIIRMAELEQLHRQQLENKAIDSDVSVKNSFQITESFRIKGIFSSDLRGQYLGAIVSVISVGGAIYTASHGAPWQVSVALVSLPVLGMIKAIRSSQEKQPLPVDAETTKKQKS